MVVRDAAIHAHPYRSAMHAADLVHSCGRRSVRAACDACLAAPLCWVLAVLIVLHGESSKCLAVFMVSCFIVSCFHGVLRQSMVNPCVVRVCTLTAPCVCTMCVCSVCFMHVPHACAPCMCRMCATCTCSFPCCVPLLVCQNTWKTKCMLDLDGWSPTTALQLVCFTAGPEC